MLDQISRQHEERFLTLFHLATDGMLVMDDNWRIKQANHAAQAMLGRDSEQLIGQPMTEVLLPQDLPEAAGCLQRLAQGRQTECRYGSRYFTGEGVSVTARTVISPLPGDEGAEYLAVLEANAEACLAAGTGLLLRATHHRVKNNLQIVSSLLELRSRKVSDPDALALIRYSQDSINSIALIHQGVCRSGDLNLLDFNQYLSDAANTLYHTHGVAPDRVRLEINAQQVWLAVDQAIPCALIVCELVSNALRHAFGVDGSGEIHVSIGLDPSGQYRMVVSDNGVGLPDEAQLRQGGAAGLKLVHALINQLQGSVHWDGTDGTAVTIVFPAD